MLARTIRKLSTTRKVIVAVANGSEEIETLAPVDILRRAGADVTLAAIGSSLQVTLSRGCKVLADTLIDQVKDQTYDLIVVPGGQPGANNMRDSPALVEMLKKQDREKRWYSAICASPVVVLQTHGLLKGKPATCHPAVANDLIDKSHLVDRVVVSSNCITSRAPGTAIEFSLSLVSHLISPAKATEISQQILSNPPSA